MTLVETPAALAQSTVFLVVTGHPAAPRTTELALALARSGQAVRVFLAPGSETYAPLPAWASLESALRHPVEVLGEPSRLSQGDWAQYPLFVAPASLDFLGRLRAADIRDPVVAAVLGRGGATLLIPPSEPGADCHPLTVQLCRDLLSGGMAMAPCGPDTLPGMLPAPESVLTWWKGLSDTPQPDQSPSFGGQSQSIPSLGSLAGEMASGLWPQLPARPVRPESGPWSGKSLLITGGPTRESLDPVHAVTTLGNGYLAWHFTVEALRLGAEVTLILGSVGYRPVAGDGLTVLYAFTAEEMLSLAQSAMAGVGGIVLADDASVIRSEKPFAVPVIRSGNSVALRMVETPDLAMALAFHARADQVVSAVQLAPLSEGTQPGQMILRRRLRALAVLDRSAEREDGDLHRPTTVAPQSLEEHFLFDGAMVRVHTVAGGSLIPSGQPASLLHSLTGWSHNPE